MRHLQGLVPPKRSPSGSLPRAAALVALLVVLVLALAACGSKSSAAVTPSPTPASTESAIASAWQRFFAGATPASQKVALLQNGQRYAAIVRAESRIPFVKAVAAKVASVTVTSPTAATVKYSILAEGVTVLSGLTGQAVKQAGVWKVGTKSFRELLSLEKKGSSPSSPSS